MIPVAATVGGLSLKSLELEQGLEILGYITALWTSSTPSLTLLKTSLELLQLEVSLSTFVLHLSF